MESTDEMNANFGLFIYCNSTAGGTFDVILTSSVQYFSAGCAFDVIGSIFGQQQLVVVNFAGGFNQLETGKYYEGIMIDNICM